MIVRFSERFAELAVAPFRETVTCARSEPLCRFSRRRAFFDSLTLTVFFFPAFSDADALPSLVARFERPTVRSVSLPLPLLAQESRIFTVRPFMVTGLDLIVQTELTL